MPKDVLNGHQQTRAEEGGGGREGSRTDECAEGGRGGGHPDVMPHGPRGRGRGQQRIFLN